MKKILSLIFILGFLFVTGCTGLQVAKPQKGGSAAISLSPSPSLTILQPENSQTATITSYERQILPFYGTNYLIRETYNSELGAHQADEARAGYAAVQKTAAVLKSQSPIMYAGLILIVAALAMSYFQAKFPAVFAPGLKLIALTFLTGLCLTILPAMTQDKTVLTFALLGGSGIVVTYILAKQFSSKTDKNSATIADTNSKENTND